MVNAHACDPSLPNSGSAAKTSLRTAGRAKYTCANELKKHKLIMFARPTGASAVARRLRCLSTPCTNDSTGKRRAWGSVDAALTRWLGGCSLVGAAPAVSLSRFCVGGEAGGAAVAVTLIDCGAGVCTTSLCRVGLAGAAGVAGGVVRVGDPCVVRARGTTQAAPPTDVRWPRRAMCQQLRGRGGRLCHCGSECDCDIVV